MAGRPHEFPDPKDRSPNSPTVIANSDKVLGLYNRANPKDKRERVTEPVRNWFLDQATNEGWNDAAFHGSDCLLTAEVTHQAKP
jgi:hypothetical protein